MRSESLLLEQGIFEQKCAVRDSLRAFGIPEKVFEEARASMKVYLLRLVNPYLHNNVEGIKVANVTGFKDIYEAYTGAQEKAIFYRRRCNI